MKGQRCSQCHHDTVFTNPDGMKECTECGSSKRPCITGCGGQQIYFKGFGLNGKLLDDDETAIEGTWQCLKCGSKEMKLRDYIMGKGGESEPLQGNRGANGKTEVSHHPSPGVGSYSLPLGNLPLIVEEREHMRPAKVSQLLSFTPIRVSEIDKTFWGVN